MIKTQFKILALQNYLVSAFSRNMDNLNENYWKETMLGLGKATVLWLIKYRR